jgi:hypothetical protein
MPWKMRGGTSKQLPFYLRRAQKKACGWLSRSRGGSGCFGPAAAGARALSTGWPLCALQRSCIFPEPPTFPDLSRLVELGYEVEHSAVGHVPQTYHVRSLRSADCAIRRRANINPTPFIKGGKGD